MNNHTKDYKDDNIWLMFGDCIERMKEIPDSSVDMILCDPPYILSTSKGGGMMGRMVGHLWKIWKHP